MITEDFKGLLPSLCGLSHHQRNVAKAAFDRQANLPKVMELVETRFGLKPACPHCAGIWWRVTAQDMPLILLWATAS